ncbi:MAG: aldo/keto reductase [Deltaproteobacteria bacterium]|nr:aldo/keto reductase [Candidatus Zymogenaceae bacterium]
MADVSSLILGTAQIGHPYGIANRHREPDRARAVRVIQEAVGRGIFSIDTAQAYGVSEKMVGAALKEIGCRDKMRVISKFHPDLNHLDSKTMLDSLDGSLARLGVDVMGGMLFHREASIDLLDRGLSDVIRSLLFTGRVEKIGVSVYSPDFALRALMSDGISIVQVPTNILDRRFIDEGVFDLAESLGKEVHVRSVFLQGLILMKPEELPEYMSFARHIVEEIRLLSQRLSVSPKQMALDFLKVSVPQARIVFGAEIPEQVQENWEFWKSEPREDVLGHLEAICKTCDERIINPSQWKQQGET